MTPMSLWLAELKIKLKKFNQKSTGHPELDLEIINNHGSWRPDQVLVKGLSGFVEIIVYPNSFEKRIAVGSDFESLSEADKKEIRENWIMKEPHGDSKWSKKP